jgi:hypothetical protein
MYHFLERLTEEADRARVRIAFQPSFSLQEADAVAQEFRSAFLGVSLDGAGCTSRGLQEAVRRLPEVGPRLFAVDVGAFPPAEARAPGPKLIEPWRALVGGLRGIRFEGPVRVHGLGSPVEYARAVGFLQALNAAPASR